MLSYRSDKTRGIVAIDLAEDRAAWRDSHAFVRAADADGARPPVTIAQRALVALRPVLVEHPLVLLDVFGMRGDQAAIKLTRHERLSIPSRVVTDPDRVAAIGAATGAAEAVRRELTAAIRQAVRAALAPGGREPDAEDVSKTVDALGGERTYWASLATPFEVFLTELAELEIEQVRAAFERILRGEAERALRLAVEALGDSAAKLKGRALAERRLSASLSTLLPTSGGHA
jgi:hypothetical protein